VTGVSGSGFLFASFCAPGYSSLYYEFTFGTTAPPQPQYRVVFIWGDGTPSETIWVPVQSKVVGMFTVYYCRAEKDHTFPAAGACEYTVNMLLVDNGFQCPDSRQVQIIANWHQDDIAAANGIVAMDPLQEDVCEGLPLINFQFADVTNFACNLQDYPLAQKPNHTPRYEQFIYGTNPVAGQGIPNLFIKVGTAQTSVRLTDASGNPVANSWTVNPTTGGTVAAYSTQSGYFEGPVVQIPVDAVTGVYALNNTYRISFNGVGTVVNDRFQVTLRNWNICNPWNGSQTNPNGVDANIATSLIYIVNGPLANAGADAAICSNATKTMNGSISDATSALWTTTGNGSFTNAISPNGAVYTPGSADITAGYVKLVLHAYGTGFCPEHTDTMKLSLDPIPAVPTISIFAGSNNFCDNNILSITLRSSVSPNGNYLWMRNGVSTGITTRDITLNDYTQAGNYTVTVYGTTANACPRTSAAFTVTIGQPATVDAGPATATVCSNQTYSTTGTYGGGASSVLWTTSGNGTFANNTDPTTLYTPGSTDISAGSATLTLTTDDPTGPCSAVSDFVTLTVVRAPSAYAGADASICQGSTYTVNDATASNYNTISWTENGAGSITGGVNTLTPTYTPAAGDIGGTITLTLTATGNGPCANISDAKFLYVDRTPTATVGATQQLCNTTSANLYLLPSG
jgi:hypothetical protein